MGMRAHFFYYFTLIAAYCGTAGATTTIQPVSKYGQIQNVENYSSNPFWNPNGPYNQKFPTPVYANGADLTAADCQPIVASLVASQCMTRDNCVGAQLSDIRPAIMVQLSRMPGHNYATACAGYIDAAFSAYVSQYGHVAATGASFPTATTANPNANAGTYKPVNPFEPKLPGFPGDPWGADMAQRKGELKQLQAQTTSTPTIAAAAFPTTAADFSFTERVENAKAGYEPFKGKSAYKEIKVEDDLTYLNRELQKKGLQDKLDGKETDTFGNTKKKTEETVRGNSSERQQVVDLIMKHFGKK